MSLYRINELAPHNAKFNALRANESYKKDELLKIFSNSELDYLIKCTNAIIEIPIIETKEKAPKAPKKEKTL